MFTGLVEYVGIIDKLITRSSGVFLSIRAPSGFFPVKLGESIAIDGCCLTLVESNLEKKSLSFEVIHQTIKMTHINTLKVGSKVHLERSATLQTLLGGHLVSGHIDCTLQIQKIDKSQDNYVIKFLTLEKKHFDYIVPQGSITICGVSLTVSNVYHDGFDISLIPETLKRTKLESFSVGDLVNIEFDMISKHISRLVNSRQREV